MTYPNSRRNKTNSMIVITSEDLFEHVALAGAQQWITDAEVGRCCWEFGNSMIIIVTQVFFLAPPKETALSFDAST